MSAPVTSRPTTRRSSGRRVLVTGAKLAISAVLIYWILQRTSPEEIFAAMGAARWPLVLAAFGLNLVGYVISLLRWRILLRAQEVEAPVLFLFLSYVTAIFFNNLLPSTVGGDTVRAYDSWRIGGSKSDALVVIFVDRFLGVLALAVFALTAALATPWLLPLRVPLLPVWVGVAATGLLLLAWLLFRRPRTAGEREAGILPFGLSLPDRLENILGKISSSFSVFRGEHAAVRKAFALSAALQVNVIVHYYLIAVALELAVPFPSFFLIIPLSLAVMAIPVSINAIGIRENIFAFFFAMFGIATSEALAFAWLAFGLVLIQGLAGGVVYAFRR